MYLFVRFALFNGIEQPQHKHRAVARKRGHVMLIRPFARHGAGNDLPFVGSWIVDHQLWQEIVKHFVDAMAGARNGLSGFGCIHNILDHKFFVKLLRTLQVGSFTMNGLVISTIICCLFTICNAALQRKSLIFGGESDFMCAV